MSNRIPEMTDPLGRYWQQPLDIREAPMDETHVLLTPHQFADLAEYSSSMPSGAYPGKCWRREELVVVSQPDGSKRFRRTGEWLLGWYGEHVDVRFVSNNWRKIIVVED